MLVWPIVTAHKRPIDNLSIIGRLSCILCRTCITLTATFAPSPVRDHHHSHAIDRGHGSGEVEPIERFRAGSHVVVTRYQRDAFSILFRFRFRKLKFFRLDDDAKTEVDRDKDAFD